MAKPRMFGVETEYAFATLGEDGRPLEPSGELHRLLSSVGKSLPHLPDLHRTGLFISNGGRFYIDCGHPEFATPECTCPSELVRYVLAGHRITLEAARALHGPEIHRVLLGRCNVDYVNGNTWGCHESYLHTCHPAVLPAQILPHLVSRIVYTGGGGFNNRSNARIEFLLEPRVPHLVHAQSETSVEERGIFHTKNEPLGSEYHRLHILAGSSNCSQLATWLKIGTTALIVAIIDRGARPGPEVTLADPVAALGSIARDPSCSGRVALEGGRATTAIEIQRHYLAQVERHMDSGELPKWASLVCRHWRETLDGLAASPLSLRRKLDWPLKLTLFKHHVERKGLDWSELDGLENSGSEEVGSELFLLDTLYGNLAEEGIFDSLERQGLLDHHAPGVDGIEAARLDPPAVGRSRLRGAGIRRFAGTPGIRCDWWTVLNARDGWYLDLSDPFATSARRRRLTASEPGPWSRLIESCFSRLTHRRGS